jgi:hypothetical protein
MYNKGKIKVQSSAKQTTSPWSKDVLTDPAGQWKFPGQVTKVPTTSGAITMHGVSKPVLGIDNLGNEQMMMPGMDYHFPGNMVTEYPMEQSDDYDEIELDDEEVEEYRRGGFIVEELPMAQDGLSTRVNMRPIPDFSNPVFFSDDKHKSGVPLPTSEQSYKNKGSLKKTVKQPTVEKAYDIASNPLTALANSRNGIPDYMGKAIETGNLDRNALEMASDVLNPVAYGNLARDTYRDVEAGNYGMAALNAASMISGIGVIGKGVKNIPFDKTYNINPWATKIKNAPTKTVGEGKNSFIYDSDKAMYNRVYQTKPNFITGYKQIKKPNQLDFSPIIDSRTEEFKKQALEKFKTLTGGKGHDIDLEQFVDYYKKERERELLKFQYQDFLTTINREKHYDTPEWKNVWTDSADQAENIFGKIEETLKQKSSPLGKRLGSGAEGTVYELVDDPSHVIKVGQTIKTQDADDLVKSFEGITDDNIARVTRAYKNGNHLIEVMPNLNVNPKFSNFSKEQVLGKLEKDAKGLMDRGFRLDIDNIHENFRYNPNKNKVDIYDISKPAAGNIDQNQEGVLRILRNHFNNFRIPETHPLYDPNIPSPAFKKGGEYEELELDDNEVDEYRRGGFIVEELPQAQNGLSTSVNMGIVPDFSNPNFYTHHNIPAPKSNGQSVIKAGTPQAKELKKSLADYREWEEGKQRALQRADVVTDVMQAGKFIPHPLAQLIGNTGTSLGSTIDLYQASRDAYDGNYGSMALNLGSVGLARVLKNKGYTRDMYNTEPNSLADIIARTGTRHGEYIPLTQLPLPFRGPATKRGIDYNRNLAMSLAGETLYDANQKQYGGSSLPIAQLGYNVSSQDSLRHQAGKTMDFEFTKGSAQGTGLSNYGNPALGNNPTKEQAVDWYMANIAPQLNHFSSAMEKGEAGDFLYNTGKDARIYAYQEYLRKTDPNNATGWQDASGNWKDRKSVPNNFDDIYNKSIGKLSENERRINVNKGRDWYYKNINNPSPGVPNPAYNATWKPRIWEAVNTYQDGGTNVNYNTPEYNQAYQQGQVTRYNPQTDIYQGQDLPAFEISAKDTRVADAVRRGRDEFATDYMVPAIKTAASFTPMGPLIGLTDAAYALSQGDTFGGVLGAGMEALPYGIGKGAKALSKFKNIGRTANTEPNVIRHVLEDPNKKSTLKKIGDKLSDAKIFPSLNIKHLPKDISFENNMYSVVARGPKGERVAYLDLRPEYHITGYKKPDGTFHAKNDVIDRMMNDSQYHQQWMDRLTTIEEKGDWLKPAMIKVDKNLWGNQMQDVLYQKGIELAKSQGFKGVRSGDTLLSPSKTKKAHERFMGEALGENMTSGVRHQIKGLTGHVNPNVEKEFLDRYAKLNKLQINPGFKKFSDLSNPSQFLYGLAATSPLAGYGALKAIDGINHLANKMQNDKRMTSLPNKQFGGAYDILELSDEEAKELKRRGYILKNV